MPQVASMVGAESIASELLHAVDMTRKKSNPQSLGTFSSKYLKCGLLVYQYLTLPPLFFNRLLQIVPDMSCQLDTKLSVYFCVPKVD